MRVLLLVLGLVIGGSLLGPPAAAEDPDVVRSLTSTDGGDGTYTVPVLNSDVPDVSVARVPAAESGEGRDVYYMLSTTMHLSPGAPIMKSYDLVNWEIVNYVYDRLAMGDASSLRNGQNSYGAGQWAGSLRYHDGRFYVAFNTNNVGGAYIFWTDDVEDGAWTRIALGRGFHDMSLFFDEADGGTPYVFYGGGSTSAVQLSEDLTTVVAEYPDITTHTDHDLPAMTPAYEGQQVFWFDGYYYIPTITWPPGGGRQVVLLRSEELLGRYTSEDGRNTYEARSVLDSDGFAQGSLVPVTTDGETVWHGFFFRDTFPVGRIPALIPATWSQGWPTFGDEGRVRLGDEFQHLVTLPPELAAAQRLKSVVTSDDFRNDAPHKPFRDEQWDLPAAPEVDESLIGVELLGNGDFESGEVAPWAVQYTADLEVAAVDGSQVLAVSGRVNNGSGPGQVLDGKVRNGVTYSSSMRVRYDEGPDTMRFIIGLSYGGGIKQAASAVAVRGEWTDVAGQFAVPDGDDVSDITLVVETPWGPNQTPADQVDYLVDDISFIGRAGVVEQPVEAEYAHNGSNLDLAWQWNHNPDNRYWSLTERPGWLRLTNGHTVSGNAVYTKAPARELAHFEEARNTLSQRTFGPRASAEISLDVSGMLDGDVAGLATYTRSFAYAGVKRVDGELTLGVVQRLQPFSDSFDQSAAEAFVPGSTVALGTATDVHLKADADFESSPGQLWVQFRYSLDGRTWEDLGSPAGPLTMDWSLSHFMGYRFGIFNYALERTGGRVDVDHYLLSGTLSADGVALDRSLLDASVAAARTLDQTGLTAAQAEQLGEALTAAEAVGSPSTQNQIDAPAQALAAVVAQLRADLATVPTPSPSPTPPPTPEPSPTGSPAPTPSTAPPSPPAAVQVDVYSTPGFHRVNGRTWHTTCEPYSQTQRCRTDIWATAVRMVDGEFVGNTGWQFNNLTYLPLLPRASWAQNPLGYSGEWTSSEGRRWRTECDTANTGRGGCRSYIWTDLVVSRQGTDGAWTHRAGRDWVFNNQVRFSS
ncbi:family 43 glycosylhydrolase [Tessaracoccus rhinocerotis]|uniref:Family 43 glycosylhydrolase n=2 Tax=Tessaracoccus rhinocerotis TaxID=1689449 RepID=A0A553K107_9ACTN|nr:family 43 glycosylhydrolase [Tessaracoccus rhinocerotis]